MTRALLSTQVAVTLSLQVIATGDTGPQVMTLPLVNLTPILFFLWLYHTWFNRQTLTAARLSARLVYAVENWLKTWPKTWLKTMPKIQIVVFPAFSWGAG